MDDYTRAVTVVRVRAREPIAKYDGDRRTRSLPA